MVEVKPIDVSCSSQDPAFPALNLVRGALKPSDERKQWLCSTPDEKFAHVVLTYEKSFVISSLEIKNNGSAYVQVEGANSEEPSKYKVLWRTQSLMTPHESRQGTETDGIYIFLPQDLAATEKDKTWDVLKITCSQPFNKLQKYGLSHVIARSALPVKEEIPSSPSPCVAAPSPCVAALSPCVTAPSPCAAAPSPHIAPLSPRVATPSPRAVEIPVTAVKTEPNDEVVNVIQAPKQPQKPMDHQSQMNSEVSSSGCSETSNSHTSAMKQETPSVDENIFSIPRRPEPSSSINSVNQHHDVQSPTIKRENSLHITADSHPTENEVPPTGTTSVLKRRISESEESSESSIDEVQVVKRPAPSNITYKPFNKLLEGVKFTISGFENPARKHIRDKALEMGASYAPFWNDSCTHLVCAFLYTPKYRQAASDHGLIITRDWVDQCHVQRKRLPWRRFALNPSERSNDCGGLEIWELQPSPSSSSQNNVGSSTSSPNLGRLVESSPVRVICSNQSGPLHVFNRFQNNTLSPPFGPCVKREVPDRADCTSDLQSAPVDHCIVEGVQRPPVLQHRCTPSPRQNITVKREINNDEVHDAWHDMNCGTEPSQSRRSQASNTSPKHHMLYSSASSSVSGEHEPHRSAGPNASLMEPGPDGYAGYYRPISQPCAVPHSSPSATYLVPPVIMLPQTLPQYFVPVSQQFQATPQSRDTYMAHTVSSSPQLHGQHIRVIQHSNKPASEEESTKQA